MSDFERYGDYNETGESPKKSPVLLAIKITAIVLCFAVVAFIFFRVFTFNYYPKNIKNVYFTDALTGYYIENGGDVKAKTQDMRAPYDDAKLGNFFAANLIVIEELGELQVSVRYNVSLSDVLAEEYGVEFDADDTSRFRFTLTKSGGDEQASGSAAGIPIDCELTYCEFDSFLMYRYVKLVFDGVDFDDAEWIRLDIEIVGADLDELFMIAIYENNAGFSEFIEYEIKGREVSK